MSVVGSIFTVNFEEKKVWSHHGRGCANGCPGFNTSFQNNNETRHDLSECTEITCSSILNRILFQLKTYSSVDL